MVGESERAQRFAFALQQAMAARKVSARQLGVVIGVDARLVARWLKAKALPNLYQADALVDALRVREDLFREPPPVPIAPDYPISDYLLGAAESAVSDAIEEGQRQGATRSRQPRAAGVPSGPEQSDRRPLRSGSRESPEQPDHG